VVNPVVKSVVAHPVGSRDVVQAVSAENGATTSAQSRAEAHHVHIRELIEHRPPGTPE
jgi:hypothetical protein